MALGGRFGERSSRQVDTGAAQSLRLGSLQTRKANRGKRRHAGLFEAVRALDNQLDESSRRELAKWIGDQYAAEYDSVVLGMVAVCYLGPPYVDHRLDLLGAIVEHYGAADPMPAPYDAARMLARSGSYAFVEVHSDGTVVPVAEDGTPS